MDPIAEAEAKLAEIQKEQRDALAGNNQIQLETETLTTARDQAVSDKADAEKDLEAVKADIDAATVARSNALAALAIVQDQIGPATADFESAKVAADKARADGIQANADVQATQDKIVADTQAKVDALVAQKASLEAEISPISDQVSRLTNQVTTLQAEIVSLNGKVDDADVALAVLVQKQSVVNDSINELQAKADSLATDIAAKTTTSAGLDGEITAKNSTITDLTTKIAALVEQLKANNQQNTDFLKMRAGLQDAQTQVDQRLAYLKQKYGELDEPWG